MSRGQFKYIDKYTHTTQLIMPITMCVEVTNNSPQGGDIQHTAQKREKENKNEVGPLCWNCFLRNPTRIWHLYGWPRYAAVQTISRGG